MSILMAPVVPGKIYDILPDGRWAFYVDHHMIAGFSDCEWKFRYRHMWKDSAGATHQLRPKGMTSAISIGSWWSSVMEDFYNGLRIGCGTRELIVTSAARQWHEHGMEALAIQEPKRYDDFGGRDGGILMAVQYWDKYAAYDNAHWKIISAELGFGMKKELQLGENDQVVAYYIGKPDLIILEDQAFLKPLDHKTVEFLISSQAKKYKPHPQTQGYIWALGKLAASLDITNPVTECMINVAARKEPTDKPRDGKKKERFLRVRVSYSQEEIEEWRQGVMNKVTRLRHAIEHDDWIRNEQSCHLYAGCEYRRLDAVPLVMREQIVNADYLKVEPWAPYKVEEGE